jgi:hypothetical protein
VGDAGALGPDAHHRLRIGVPRGAGQPLDGRPPILRLLQGQQDPDASGGELAHERAAVGGLQLLGQPALEMSSVGVGLGVHEDGEEAASPGRPSATARALASAGERELPKRIGRVIATARAPGSP